MTLAVLELNDQGLLMQAEGGPVYSEPGFALLTAAGIDTGESARAAAWLQPQSSYHQYWRQLNQTALPAPHPQARHYADIAFAQLRQLHRQAGAPEQLIMAVPGSFSDSQLSLLLGLARALPVTVQGIIDSSLALALALPQQTLMLDLQLHQVVLSLLQPQAGELRLVAQEIIPDLGQMTLYNTVAQHIGRRLIEDYRYDPLHSSAGEQAIYDQLPGWLVQLADVGELSVSLASPQGDLSLVLRQSAIASLLEERLEHLLAAVGRLQQRYPEARLCCSQPSKLIPAFIDSLATAQLLNSKLALTNCFARAELIVEQSEPLHRLTALPLVAAGAVAELPDPVATASHVLYQHRAWPLGQPLSISLNGEGLALAAGIDYQAGLVVVLEQQQLTVLHQQPALSVALPRQASCGESLQVGPYQLALIEVHDGR